jgi:cobalt/nickel transport system permease protein
MLRHDFLIRFSRLESPIHKAPVSIKLSCLLALTMGLLMIPFGRGDLFAYIGLILFMVAVKSELPLLYIVRRMLMLEPFVIGATLFALTQENGLIRFVWVLTRVTLSLFALVLFASTTPFSAVLLQLRTWKVPTLLTTVMALMYRYGFLLADEAEKMSRARKGRAFSKKRRRIWGQITTVIAQLFLRSSERGERVLSAMQARGLR